MQLPKNKETHQNSIQFQSFNIVTPRPMKLLKKKTKQKQFIGRAVMALASNAGDKESNSTVTDPVLPKVSHYGDVYFYGAMWGAGYNDMEIDAANFSHSLLYCILQVATNSIVFGFTVKCFVYSFMKLSCSKFKAILWFILWPSRQSNALAA